MPKTNALSLTPAMFEILVSLADGERHGYAIMQDIGSHHERGRRMGPGTLYRSIERLIEQDLIVEAVSRPRGDLDDERRRYYRITDSGRRAAEAEARRVAELVALAQAKRLLPKVRTR